MEIHPIFLFGHFSVIIAGKMKEMHIILFETNLTMN
jgi:hypothetical protein